MEYLKWHCQACDNKFWSMAHVQPWRCALCLSPLITLASVNKEKVERALDKITEAETREEALLCKS